MRNFLFALFHLYTPSTWKVSLTFYGKVAKNLSKVLIQESAFALISSSIHFSFRFCNFMQNFKRWFVKHSYVRTSFNNLWKYICSSSNKDNTTVFQTRLTQWYFIHFVDINNQSLINCKIRWHQEMKIWLSLIKLDSEMFVNSKKFIWCFWIQIEHLIDFE